jgi:hypothetical protein
MQQSQESRSSEETVVRGSFSDFALRIAGPADGRLEVSIDGAAYQPCRYADGFWWYHWSGTLEGSHHMVIILRPTVEEPAHRA